MRKLGKKGNYYLYFRDPDRSPKDKSYPLKTTSKREAKRRKRKVERKVFDGEFDPWNPDDSPAHLTLEEAKEAFLESKSNLRPKTLDTYRGILERFIKGMPPNLMFKDLSSSHLRPFILKESLANSTKRKRYRHLRVFLKWAVDKGLRDESPLQDVQQPKEEKKEAAFLSPKDLKKLLGTIDRYAETTVDAVGRSPDVQWLKDTIQIAVCTGLRRSALVNLRWRDVNLDIGYLTVRNSGDFKSKTGHERSIPLAGDAKTVLQRLDKEREQSDPDQHVIIDRRNKPIKPNRISKRFKFFIREADLDERLRFHSTRHTCISWLVMKGVPLRVVQGISGHSTIEMVEQYSHLQPEVKIKAMEETFG